jgi:TPR repeat protein
MQLPEGDFWEAVRRLSVLQKRRGDLDAAIRWWEHAAAQGHIYAHIELSKYYEHRRRTYPQALQWAESALEQVNREDLPDYVREHWRAELDHRLARLQRKMNSGPAKRKKHV